MASVKGTLSQDIINVLHKTPLSERCKVKEVTLDMANNMSHAVKMSFPQAKLTTDHFHVIRLAMEALQHLRIKYRWEEMDKENQDIKQAREKGIQYKAVILPNEDTPKQLLARCRYIIAKRQDQWTTSQKQRARLLFERYPDLQNAYNHVIKLRNIFQNTDKNKAEGQLKDWLTDTKSLQIKEFNSVANTIKDKLSTILNYFDHRHTNANAESFNAKIKLFRANLRGVVDPDFFLFRLEKLFA